MSKKAGRNTPCPCGSGKKYKRCCLPIHEAERATRSAPPSRPLSAPPPAFVWDDHDDLDDLSNSVVDFIHDGKLDDAERACDELDRRYPDMIDGIERRAMLLEARGQSKLAADTYRAAAVFARADEGFDKEISDGLIASADRLHPSSKTES